MIRVLRYHVLARFLPQRIIVSDALATRRRFLDNIPQAQELKFSTNDKIIYETNLIVCVR